MTTVSTRRGPASSAALRITGISTSAISVSGSGCGHSIRSTSNSATGFPTAAGLLTDRTSTPSTDRAQALFQIEATTYDVTAWGNDHNRRRLPFTGDDVETIIFKIGYQDVFLNRCRNEIVNRDDNVIVLIYANVVDIETNDTARTVSRLRVACLGGSQFWVNAKVVILAAGGIEIPRLLLLSNRTQKTGLGNPHDLVGRFFMEHPHFWSGVYVPRDQRLLDSMALYQASMPLTMSRSSGSSLSRARPWAARNC